MGTPPQELGRGFTPAYPAARRGEPVPRATSANAFAAAREVYLAGRRLEMRELAGKLGIARTTLYRWCGSREQPSLRRAPPRQAIEVLDFLLA